MDLLLQMASLGKWIGPKSVSSESADGKSTEPSSGEGLEGVNLSFPSLLVQQQGAPSLPGTPAGVTSETEANLEQGLFNDGSKKSVSELTAETVALQTVLADAKPGGSAALALAEKFETTTGTEAAQTTETNSAAKSLTAVNAALLAAAKTTAEGSTETPTIGNTTPANSTIATTNLESTTLANTTLANTDVVTGETQAVTVEGTKGSTAVPIPKMNPVAVEISTPISDQKAAPDPTGLAVSEKSGESAVQWAAQTAKGTAPAQTSAIPAASVSAETNAKQIVNPTSESTAAIPEGLKITEATVTAQPEAPAVATAASIEPPFESTQPAAHLQDGGFKAYAETEQNSAAVSPEDLQDLVRDFQSNLSPTTPSSTTAMKTSLNTLAAPSVQNESAVREQVVQHIATNTAGLEGTEKMTLQLNPENLGNVEIRFEGSGNKLSVVLVAAGREAEQMLREGVKEVADAIVERSGRWQQVDIKVEQRDVDDRRQDRSQDGRKNDQEKDQNHGGRDRQNHDSGEQANRWAESRLGV
jgi:flagellar hook-length control protein FliK